MTKMLTSAEVKRKCTFVSTYEKAQVSNVTPSHNHYENTLWRRLKHVALTMILCTSQANVSEESKLHLYLCSLR